MTSLSRSRPHRVAVVLLVFVATIGLCPPLVVAGFVTQLEVALFLGFGSTLLVLTSSRTVSQFALSVPMTALLAVMGLSVLWSESRSQTVRDVAVVAVLAIAAALIVSCSEVADISVGVAAAALVVLGWALVALAVDPHSALSTVGALAAPYGNRNTLAYVLVFGCAAALSLAWTSGWRLIAKWSTVGVLSFATLSTRSLTSILALAVVGLSYAVFVLIRRRRAAVIASMAGLLVVVIAVLNAGRLLEFFGKGTTINGRIPVWEALLPVIAARPATGYGWSLAWPRGGTPSEAVARKLDGVVLFHAHNELLNWMVTTGVVGTILVVAVYVTVLVGGWRRWRTGDPAGALMFIAGGILLVRGFGDISETGPLGWFILSLLAAYSARVTSRLEVGRWRLLSYVVPLRPRHPVPTEGYTHD